METGRRSNQIAMNRDILSQPIPRSVFTYRSQAMIVLTMAMIAVIFIVVFRPFNIYESLDFLISKNLPNFIDSAEDAFYLALTSVVLLGIIMIFGSRVIMVRTMRNLLTYRGYILWGGIEFIIVALAITILSASLFHPETTSIFRLFTKVLGRTACILFIPYAFCSLYIVIIDKVSQLKALHESIANEEIAQQKAYILLYDEHNEMRLSVKREDLIMIESADNYVCVWYINNDQIKKVLIRNTMKRVASQLSKCSVQRCHRSYMINMDRVKVLRRDKEGVFIEFGIEGVPDVPISRTYIDNITSWLMK